MTRFLPGILGCLLSAPALGAQEPPEYEAGTAGTRMLEGRGGFSIKMLVEQANFGGSELEMGEITFPAGSRGSEHRHGSTEIFYVLSGELDHIVNGVSHPLTPGMVGIVRAGDRVVHRVTSAEPVRALVVWVPGGEAGRIAPGLRQRPIDP
ncbi:MAG: cupin domain-containing protein [Gemmatimonadota bacterium]